METDYISRRAFIEAKEKQYCQNCDRRKNSKGQVVYSIGDAPCRACGIGDMLDDVEDFPAADVRPVEEGYWIENCTDYTCSACGGVVSDEIVYMLQSEGLPDYCPYCGVKLKGGQP